MKLLQLMLLLVTLVFFGLFIADFFLSAWAGQYLFSDITIFIVFVFSLFVVLFFTWGLSLKYYLFKHNHIVLGAIVLGAFFGGML